LHRLRDIVRVCGFFEPGGLQCSGHFRSETIFLPPGVKPSPLEHGDSLPRRGATRFRADRDIVFSLCLPQLSFNQQTAIGIEREVWQTKNVCYGFSGEARQAAASLLSVSHCFLPDWSPFSQPPVPNSSSPRVPLAEFTRDEYSIYEKICFSTAVHFNRYGPPLLKSLSRTILSVLRAVETVRWPDPLADESFLLFYPHLLVPRSRGLFLVVPFFQLLGLSPSRTFVIFLKGGTP